MDYKELRDWYIKWGNANPDPVPLTIGKHFSSKDVRRFIGNSLRNIDRAIESKRMNFYITNRIKLLKEVKKELEQRN